MPHVVICNPKHTDTEFLDVYCLFSCTCVYSIFGKKERSIFKLLYYVPFIRTIFIIIHKIVKRFNFCAARQDLMRVTCMMCTFYKHIPNYYHIKMHSTLNREILYFCSFCYRYCFIFLYFRYNCSQSWPSIQLLIT